MKICFSYSIAMLPVNSNIQNNIQYHFKLDTRSHAANVILDCNNITHILVIQSIKNMQGSKSQRAHASG